MCVIITGRKQKPTLQTLYSCARANGDGAGIAWSTDEGVEWKKGIDHKEVDKILRERVKGDWVVHFRYATVGGKSAALCHPFSLDASASLADEGKAERVLFHNGHWNGWALALREAVLSEPTRMPEGEWSDSRAIAMLAHLKGTGVLNLIPGKFAVLDRSGVELFPLDRSGWKQIGKMWFSNLNWQVREGLSLCQN